MLPLFFSLMFVLLVVFWLNSRLIRIEYDSHRENWEEDGKPADYFLSIPGSFGFAVCLSTSWLFATPDWMKAEPRALRIIIWYRVLFLMWFVGLVVMVYLESRRQWLGDRSIHACWRNALRIVEDEKAY